MSSPWSHLDGHETAADEERDALADHAEGVTGGIALFLRCSNQPSVSGEANRASNQSEQEKIP